ncbi:MAG: iron-sulfur cluster assembly scaffold protein [archaeon]
MDEYSEEILDHYLRPRKRGRIAGASAKATLANPVCGDRISVQLKISGGKIEKAAFEGTGCAISTAAASMFMEEIEGKSVSTVRKFGRPEIMRLLKVGLTPAREHCALISLEAVQKALGEFGLRAENRGRNRRKA